jgi:uncharacterized protein (DUF1501 family)
MLEHGKDRQPRHLPRPRQRHVAPGRRRQGRQGLRQWPGLDSPHLYENRDLAVTTDAFAEILEKRMRLLNLKSVFPGYDLDEKKRLGLIA